MTEEQQGPRPLTDQDRAIIEFERLHWRYIGAKEAEILARFDMSPTRYYQILAFLRGHPDAEVYDPQTVHRLQRLADARARLRNPSRLQVD